jgi:hypothetical protein
MEPPVTSSPAKPPLEDPLNEKEIFANEVATVGSIHGNIAITLSNVRFSEPAPGNQPKPHRVVAARLMLTTPAAVQLLQSLQNLVAQLDAAQKAAAAKGPN